MPLARGPQIGFPAGFHSVEQSPDHVLTEELDQVGGDAAFQVQGSTVLEAAAFAGLTYGAAFHQHEDGVAVGGAGVWQGMIPSRGGGRLPLRGRVHGLGRDGRR